MTTTVLTRVFEHNDIVLADPDPSITPEEVKTFYSTAHPELMNSKVVFSEYDLDANAQRYKFITKMGTNG